MMLSPYITELVELSPPRDDASAYSTAITALRAAERSLRAAVKSLEHARSPAEIWAAERRRARAASAMIDALFELRAALVPASESAG